MLSDIQRPVSASVVKSIWRSVLAGNAGPAPLPDPTTVNFTAAQFAAGFTGSISTTKNAARIYGRGDRTLWAGFIAGSAATLKVTSDFNNMDNMIQVSVDGAAFYNCPHTADMYELFAGLGPESKFVQIRYAFDWSDVTYIASSGDVLFVTGQPPAMTTISGWIQAGENSDTGFYSAATVPNTAGYTPARQAVKGTTNGSNIGSIKIAGAFSELYAAVTGNPARIGVSKNGGAPSFYSVTDEGTPKLKTIRVPCDGSLATYNIWDSGGGLAGGGHFSVAGDATRQTVGDRKRMDQFGDSITFGSGPGATQSDTETMHVAAQLGFTGSTNGVSGHTIAQCKALLDVVLPLKTISASDVAVLAIGRNNVGAGIDATAQTDYGLCIDKLVAAGYGKVLCRAVLPPPSGSELWTAQNAALQAVVTAKANPNVIWIPTSTWLGYDSTDATHPTDAGYLTLAGYAIPAYTSALGL